MHLDSQVIVDFINGESRLSPEESDHLQDCDACRNAVRNVTTHADPRRLFELAQLDVIFEESEWPHLIVCDACSSRFTSFLQVRVQEEKKLNAKGVR
jgi:hypothetical protein